MNASVDLRKDVRVDSGHNLRNLHHPRVVFDAGDSLHGSEEHGLAEGGEFSVSEVHDCIGDCGTGVVSCHDSDVLWLGEKLFEALLQIIPYFEKMDPVDEGSVSNGVPVD